MKSITTLLTLILFAFPQLMQAQEFTAHLSGSNETHLVTTMASGMVEAELDGNELTVTGSFSGLSSPVATEIAGGAHLHMGLAGQDGPVVFVLEADLDADMLGGTFSAENNTFTLESEELEALNTRMLYVNIHTEMFEAGELRGQLVPATDQTLRVNLTGNNEVPPIATEAMGGLVVELDDHTITVSGSFSGLSSPVAVDIAGGAHIHMGQAGEEGDVLFVLEAELDDDMLGGVFLAADNEFQLSHSQLVALLNRELYVNIHSEMFMAGELRGQIISQADAVFQANLSGAAETHVVDTEAFGAVVGELNGNMLAITGSFSGLSSPVDTEIAGGAHIHIGIAGTDGDVVFVLEPSLSSDGLSGHFNRSDNTFELSEAELQALFNRELYVNIHTENFAAGEIRGQLLAEARTYFSATLAGINEADEIGPVTTMASGALLGELTGDRLIVSGSFNNLESPLAVEIAGGAHLHEGFVGELGGVAFVLNADSDGEMTSGTFRASANMFTIDNDILLETFYEGGIYANIHSEMFPSGEIRGQFLSGLSFFPGQAEITSPMDGAEIKIMGADMEVFAAEWNTADDMSGHNVGYIWQLSADAEFSSEAILVNAVTAQETMFETTLGVVDMILAEAGVEVGQTVTLHHRVISGNGSLNTEGEAKTVVLTRGLVTDIDEPQTNLPERTELGQNYPNPFNPTTNITFNLANAGFITLEVYNMLGQRVASLVNERMNAGSHTVSFDASNLSSGMYIYRLNADGFVLTRKMMLIK